MRHRGGGGRRAGLRTHPTGATQDMIPRTCFARLVALLVALAVTTGASGAAPPPGRANCIGDDLLRALEAGTGEKATLTADEEKMLADGLDGKLSRLSLAEAVLVADGTEAAPRREACLDRIALLQKQARAALARARTPAEKAEQLLRWLHAGAMKKGYQKQQSSLAVLLESGK